MPLKNRVYVCPECGYIEDRELNAAKNIDRWFENIFTPEQSETVSFTGIACGMDKPLRSLGSSKIYHVQFWVGLTAIRLVLEPKTQLYSEPYRAIFLTCLGSTALQRYFNALNPRNVVAPQPTEPYWVSQSGLVVVRMIFGRENSGCYALGAK